jgi:hypothetical protein
VPYNIRIVLVNRRDYPGSDPYTDVERNQLAAAATASEAEALKIVEDYMRDRARELFDFLAAYVKQEYIPTRRGDYGGIVFCAWSFAATWMTAFLGNAALFSAGDIDLTQYLRRVVLYG